MKVCSFVKIIMMNKMSKNHKLLLFAAIIQKSMEKSGFGF